MQLGERHTKYLKGACSIQHHCVTWMSCFDNHFDAFRKSLKQRGFCSIMRYNLFTLSKNLSSNEGYKVFGCRMFLFINSVLSRNLYISESEGFVLFCGIVCNHFHFMLLVNTMNNNINIISIKEVWETYFFNVLWIALCTFKKIA